jgi:cyanophycin synthetase
MQDMVTNKLNILDIKVLRGPNYWSNYRKNLIVIKLDIQEFENLPTNLIKGFNFRLKKLIPSLYSHYCSPGHEGGFFERLDEGTWLGHVIEHVALELQVLAGMDCGFGRTRSTHEKNVYHVVYSYQIEKAGIYAGKAAVNLIEALANNNTTYEIEKDIHALKEIFYAEKLGPSTEAIVKEAQERNIPWLRLDNNSLILLGQGCNQKIIMATMTNTTSSIGVEIASDKELTKNLLQAAFIPVPNGFVINTIEELNNAVSKFGFPLVIKPKLGNHGRGIITNIRTIEKAYRAFYVVQNFTKDILVEKYMEGSDYRFLMVDFKVAAVAMRQPAEIVGNGFSTIKELIEQINNDPERGNYHEKLLTKIIIDDVTISILSEQYLNLNSIIPFGKKIKLKDAANLSAGGTAIDVTDIVHPQNIFLAERIAKLINLDLCGIDMIANDVRLPFNEQNAAVLEVNAAPGLRMHLSPSAGKKRNVAKPIIDMLFPNHQPARIPIVAVTGTNGKTSVVRFIAYLAQQMGHTVGYTTTDGIYLNNQVIAKGDCSGPVSAAVIIKDPTVDFAVLECARGGIIRAGLGFDHCNISIITNLSSDHLGLNDIYTLDEMLRVKSVVAKSTFEDGYAILNADDNLVYSIIDDLSCHLALFSLSPTNPRVISHCEKGGLGIYVDGDSIIVSHNKIKKIISKIYNWPITFDGKAEFMLQNLLPTVLVGVIQNYKIEKIESALKKFIPSVNNLPGRMNTFMLNDITVIIDYAHNIGAFTEIKKYIMQLNVTKKVCIIGVPGDRRKEDIINIGYIAAQIFDEIIIRHDKDGRGRSNTELSSLLTTGIFKYNPDCKITIITEGTEAVTYAMANAIPKSLIFYFPDDVLSAIEHLNTIKDISLK